MAKQITYSIQQYSQIELAELAKLAVEIWNAKGNQYSVERFTSWLENLEYTIEPQIIQARKNSELVGWLMLFAHSPTELELNPFALSGHPIISQNENIEEITSQLLKHAIDQFQQDKYSLMEIQFNKEGTELEELLKKLYSTKGFVLTEQICHMRMNLQGSNELYTINRENISSKHLSQVNLEELFECFYIVFRNSKDSWMQSLTDAEMSDFYTTRIINSPFKLIDDCSIVLSDKEDQIIGFSVVRESHGQNNGHLWIMGIHPNYRRKGYGNFLVNTMITKLQQNNYKTASLNVDISNDPAYQLYKHLGFKDDWIKLVYALRKDK